MTRTSSERHVLCAGLTSTVPLGMGLNTIAVGTYEIWAIYDRPAANAEEWQKLEQAGIAVPNGRFQSDKLTYKVTFAKQ